MVKKDLCDDSILHISIVLIAVSAVFMLVNVVCCALMIHRRNFTRYCDHCKRVLQCENELLKKRSKAAHSQEISVIRAKEVISGTLTTNPEYNRIPDNPGVIIAEFDPTADTPGPQIANNPEYAPISNRDCSSADSLFGDSVLKEDFSLLKSKDFAIRIPNADERLPYEHLKRLRHDPHPELIRASGGGRSASPAAVEYEYMRSPQLGRKTETYVTMKLSSHSITSSNDAL